MIDTQAIRKKILDLALRGKLTEQLPEVGTGQELFQHIQERKAVLAGTGKAKKQEPLVPLSEEDIPFEIPDNWQWVRLGDITAKITSGSTPTGGKKSDAYVDKGFCFFREQNIYNDGIHSEGMVYITEQLLNTRENSTVIAKDILLNITGGSIGRCAIVPDDFSKGSINQHILIIRMVEEETRFFTHLVLCSPYAQNHIKSKAVGDKDGFSGGRCKYMPVPLPPLSVQKRIVSIIHSAFSVLDTIDTLQSQYQDNLATLKSKIIDAGIQGKLTEQLPEDGTAEELYQQIQQEKRKVLVARGGKEDKSIKPIEEDVPYILPSTWKWIRFGDIGLCKKGPFGSALTKSMFVPKSDTTIKVYEQQHAINKNKNLGTYYITREYFDEKMQGFEVRPGDVIISCAGTIGETYILPDDIEQGIINQALMRVTIVPSIDKKFFQLFFDARLKRNAQSQSNGSAINNIPPFEVLKNWYFPLPPLAEQKRIVAKLEELLPLCEG